MQPIKWPTVLEVVRALTPIRSALVESVRLNQLEGEARWWEVRLEVCEGGQWKIHTGDPEADFDSGGFWGTDHVGTRCSLAEVAQSLLEEAMDHYYVAGGV